jgi:hypothetical protein
MALLKYQHFLSNNWKIITIFILLSILATASTNTLSIGRYQYVFPPLEKPIHKKATYSKYDYSVETPETNNIYNTNHYRHEQSVLPNDERKINDSNLRYDDPRIRIPGFLSQ